MSTLGDAFNKHPVGMSIVGLIGLGIVCNTIVDIVRPGTSDTNKPGIQFKIVTDPSSATPQKNLPPVDDSVWPRTADKVLNGPTTTPSP